MVRLYAPVSLTLQRVRVLREQKSLILNSKKKKSFKVQKNKAGNYFFNVIMGNNKVIATSQAYKSESSLKKE